MRTQVLDESDWDEGGQGAAFPGGLHHADDEIDAYLQGSTQYEELPKTVTGKILRRELRDA
jgi:acyl-CoA synthetase (AMP-forming)/AMP-acid ligase II